MVYRDTFGCLEALCDMGVVAFQQGVAELVEGAGTSGWEHVKESSHLLGGGRVSLKHA